MQYTITIDTDNSAFEENPAGEVTNVLAQLTNRIGLFGLEDEAPIRDANGNQVGKAVLSS